MRARHISACFTFGALALTAHTATAQGVPASTEAAPTETRAGILGDAVARIPGELERIVRFPFDETDEFAKAALGIGLLVLLDKPVTTAYQKHIEGPLDGFNLPAPPKVFPQSIGAGPDGWLLLGISGTYLGGLATNDARAQKTGLAATKAVAYSFVISQLVLKSIAGRNRPNPTLGRAPVSAPYTDNPFDWGHVHAPVAQSSAKATAFPSFHFTAYFAAAKVYQEAYNNTWVPYGLMTLGLASGIKGHHHWVSDMAAGALIGTLIGSSVSKGYFGSSASKLQVVPTVGQGGTGLQAVYRF